MLADLPRWDTSDVFPSVGSRPYAAARESFSASITRLEGLYDHHGVRAGASGSVDDAAAAAFDEVLDATNAVAELAGTLAAYLTSFVAIDSADDLAQGEMSALQTEMATLTQLRTRFDGWVAGRADALAARSSAAADHAYPLARAEQRAARQLSEPEEHLLADLALTGSSAWSRLYSTFTSQLSVSVDLPSGPEEMPISRVRGLAHSDDGQVRRAAYAAELAAWAANEVPIIAALNAVKGEAGTVNRRRGWVDDLEPALVSNAVDRPTLDALQSAVVAHLPVLRRYLRAKAAILGHDGPLPWYDLFAPVGDSARFSWEEATASVESAFDTYGPQLGGLVRRAVAEKWIDAQPRSGKRDGAFCMRFTGDRSLVMLNFDGAFRGVQTLAHELGHAYHNVTLAERTPMQRALPMTLAETASIFCETVAMDAGLATATGAGRLALLEGDLAAACQLTVDIHSRFLFERDFCSARAQRTVSAKEACQLMADAQEATYGDGLHPDFRHSYMWAAKGHYYSSAFYNWPYTFGMLFGLGLYAKYQSDPETFRGGYDDLLSSVGMASAADLAARFDIDTRDEAFWTSSLRVIAGRVDEYEALALAGSGTLMQ